jgi:hypothetical protein
MSYGDMPPTRPAPPPGPPPLAPPPQRHGCLTALMVIAGLILLLPGLCALVFGVGSLTSGGLERGILPFVLVGLLVGAGGVLMIRWAFRAPGR